MANPPFDGMTTIPFTVVYEIESLALKEKYIDALEREILATAVTGALQCNTSGPIFDSSGPFYVPRANGSRAIVPMNTTATGDGCKALISACRVFETIFQIVVNEDLNPDVAAFLGYVSLQEEMDRGAFVAAVPILDRCKYLRPLPLLPPVDNNDDNGLAPEPELSPKDRVSVSPWTLGAVSTMCKSQGRSVASCSIIPLSSLLLSTLSAVVGIIALVAWLRNRMTRNRRHMELIEDMSMSVDSRA